MIVSVFFSQFLLLGIIVIDYNGLHSVCLARFSSAFLFVCLWVAASFQASRYNSPPPTNAPKVGDRIRNAPDWFYTVTVNINHQSSQCQRELIMARPRTPLHI